MVWCKAGSVWSLKKVLSVLDWVLQSGVAGAGSQAESSVHQQGARSTAGWERCTQVWWNGTVTFISLFIYPSSNTGCHFFLRIWFLYNPASLSLTISSSSFNHSAVFCHLCLKFCWEKLCQKKIIGRNKITVSFTAVPDWKRNGQPPLALVWYLALCC